MKYTLPLFAIIFRRLYFINNTQLPSYRYVNEIPYLTCIT